MMHSSERQLRNLLNEDTDSSVDPTVAEHVANCSSCQSKLSKLSGVGAWTHEMISHLRSLEEPERQLRDLPPQTTVDLQLGSAEHEEIEVDPISLDFLEPASHPELLGRIGRFDVERVIGSGGMGSFSKPTTASSTDPWLSRCWLRISRTALRPETLCAGSSSGGSGDPSECTVPSNVESDGKLPYLVMQYVAGESLQTRVDRLGPLPITDALRIAQQTAAGDWQPRMLKVSSIAMSNGEYLVGGVYRPGPLVGLWISSHSRRCKPHSYRNRYWDTALYVA